MSQPPRSRRPITVFLVVVVGLLVGITGLAMVLFGIGVISPTVVNIPGINLNIQTATPGYIVMGIGFALALVTIVMAIHVDAARAQEVARLQARLQVLEAARDHLSIALDVARQREATHVPAPTITQNAPGPAVPRVPVPYVSQGMPYPPAAPSMPANPTAPVPYVAQAMPAPQPMPETYPGRIALGAVTQPSKSFVSSTMSEEQETSNSPDAQPPS